MQTRFSPTKITQASFEKDALDTFQYQAVHCKVYAEYIQLMGVNPTTVSSISDIPFLPIRFFKSHVVVCKNLMPQKVFTSSSTSGNGESRHPVADISLYEESFHKCFEQFYGSLKEWCILALLPNYLERKGSSLVYMADKLITDSRHPHSGFFLNDINKLNDTISKLETSKQKTLLLGVSYALLDFAEQFPQQLKNTTVMETGGMKGHREELSKAGLHEQLCKGFGVAQIHSEYGMTELLSQAYSRGSGIYETPAWMRVFVRDMNDPLNIATTGRGALNVIDLANQYSCSFIATDDAALLHENGSFEILGRLDFSDMRGCSLLYV
ncbi:MAG: acyl transferase [Flavobacteriaceae bacterium]|nr:acyl transferase [Flavobacteriaceae bacterium]